MDSATADGICDPPGPSKNTGTLPTTGRGRGAEPENESVPSAGPFGACQILKPFAMFAVYMVFI